MSTATAALDLDQLPVAGHVSWKVPDHEAYLTGVDRLLALAEERDQKAVLFGPGASSAPAGLKRHPVACADPRTAFLGGSSLVPAAMLSAVAQQAELARREGYSGLMVIADMDWLLPLEPTDDEIVSFELLLDQRVRGLAATVVCAYRGGSFGEQLLTTLACVHPVHVGPQPPPFRLVGGTTTSWCLSGEVDFGGSDYFGAALRAAASCGKCDLDVSGLEFMDASGMRVMAQEASGLTIRLSGARGIVRRSWQVSGFANETPTLQFAD